MELKGCIRDNISDPLIMIDAGGLEHWGKWPEGEREGTKGKRSS